MVLTAWPKRKAIIGYLKVYIDDINPDNVTNIVIGIKELGFTYVTFDLCVYCTGSMNKTLNEV